jgi:hypothetical protein
MEKRMILDNDILPPEPVWQEIPGPRDAIVH